MMDLQVVDMKSEDLHDPKRQKLEEEDDNWEETSASSSDDTWDNEDVRLFDEEHNKHGDYDFDASKVGRLVIFFPVNFEDSEYATEPETDGELMDTLSKLALKKYNADKSTDFELVRAVKANWSLGGGHVFSITLEAKEASSSSSDPVPFHAKVRYLLGGSTVFDVKPRP